MDYDEMVELTITAHDRHVPEVVSRFEDWLTGTVKVSPALAISDERSSICITGILPHRATCNDPLAFTGGRENCLICGLSSFEHHEDEAS